MDQNLEFGELAPENGCAVFFIGRNVDPSKLSEKWADSVDRAGITVELWDPGEGAWTMQQQVSPYEPTLIRLPLDAIEKIAKAFSDKAFAEWQYLPPVARGHIDTVMEALETSEGAYLSADTRAAELSYEIARRDNLGLWRTIREWFKRS